MHLHGKQKQTKRLDIFQRFTTSKNAILFATDIAARGLDFPSIDWVIQLDAPEDADTYIHRVGRTARYESKGQSLLFLLPSEEEAMIKRLEEKSVKVEKIKVKESKTISIQNQLQSFAFQDPEIKYLGQKVRNPFVSMIRFLYFARVWEIAHRTIFFFGFRRSYRICDQSISSTTRRCSRSPSCPLSDSRRVWDSRARPRLTS